MSYDYNDYQNSNSNNGNGQYSSYYSTNQSSGSNANSGSTSSNRNYQNGASQGTGYQSGNNNYYNDSYYTTSYKEVHSDGKKKKAKPIIAAIAILMAGILAGSGTAYGIMKTNEKKQELVADSKTQEVVEEKSDEDAKLSLADPAEEVDEEILQNTTSTTASNTEMSVAQIAEKCLSSVVAITNKGETEIRSMWGNFTQESESSGSGVIIGETDTELLILTNYHVIEDNNQLSVVFSWEEESKEKTDADITTAVVKDYDASHDIAVIAIPMSSLNEDTKDQIRVAAIGNSDALALGQQVVAIGNALGYGQSVTTGIVSAMDRTVQTNSTIGAENKYIQTDAAINPGNSGGALFNMRGELVGINSAKIASGTVEGMGYAIPITQIMDAVETMMNQEARAQVPEENRGYLGVSVIDVTEEVNQTYGLPKGIYINSVSEGNGAGAAGLMKGDIVTAVNGKTVTNIAQLKEYLSYYAYGETVTVTYQRQGQGGYEEKQAEVTLISAKENTASGATNQETEEQKQEDPERPEDGTTEYVNPFNLFPFGNFGF